jgi:transposase
VPGARASTALIAYVVAQYQGGRSLRQIAELTDRSHSAVRNLLHRAGVYRRAAGTGNIGRAENPNYVH